MYKGTDHVEVAMFRWLVARLVTLQKQVYEKYQGDGNLVYQLLTAVDIPEIKASLEDRMPWKKQTAAHRVSNRLSDKQGTAGATGVPICSEREGQDDYTQEIEAMYSL